MDKATIQLLQLLGLNPNEVIEYLPDHLTLSYVDGVLSLYNPELAKTKLNVDFTSGSLQHRSQQHLGGEHVIKACQIKGQKKSRVLDATCGLGTDSYLLHQAGFEVTACEKHPVVFALLKDGIKRVQSENEKVMFSLFNIDSLKMMSETNYDVIYLDPMFPHSKKSAKNKLGMQLFQQLYHNKADNALELVEKSFASDCKRVVIKRPVKADLVTTFKPTFQVKGKTSRFDAYQIS